MNRSLLMVAIFALSTSVPVAGQGVTAEKENNDS